MTWPDQSRAPFYRLYFGLATLCSLGFAIWMLGWPRAFPYLLDREGPGDVLHWAGLGILSGLCAAGCLFATYRPDRAVPIIALCMLGMVVAPIAWFVRVWYGSWSVRSFTVVLFTDLVWWLPFTLFLIEPTRAAARLRRSAPYICAALNLLAALAVPLLLLPGLEVSVDPVARFDYIASHPLAWRAGWGIWMIAALSLLGFYSWWAARIDNRRLGIVALTLAAAGMGGDLLAESLYVGWLPAGGERIEVLARLLTGAWGNTLYTVCGILLTLGSGWLRGPARAGAWAVWTAGLALGVASLAGSATGISVSMALLFILFCPWVVWLGLLDRRRIA